MTLTIPRGDKKPIVWSIAGSDCAGGAGLQTDLKTLTAFGVHACTIVTSVTAQNTATVRRFESISPAMLGAQIEALQEDLPPQAVKIGMLGNAAGVQVLAKALRTIGAYTVFDPVMFSTSGTQLLSDETLAIMCEELLPCVDLLTPNLTEAESLTQIKILCGEDVEKAATKLLGMGVKAVLIKGWDSGAGFSQDYYCNGTKSFWLTLPKCNTEVPRGTGCTMASALAAAHAFGFDEADAAVIAKAYVHRCIRLSHKIGGGPPIAEHHPWPVEATDFPWLSSTSADGRHEPLFPDCGDESLGFYPVVDSVDWLHRLLPLGVRTAQLRIKNLQGAELEAEIIESIELAHQHNTRLFINDYWQLAIKHGAYGVHLGQEDLATIDIAELEKNGLRLGISTHSYAEAARALALRPSYIALGPIFPTTLKSMSVEPQGIETLRIWRKLFTCPLVAIGGITLDKAPDLYQAGADSIAVVSDITQNADPEARVKKWLQLTEMGKGSAGKRNRLSAIT